MPDDLPLPIISPAPVDLLPGELVAEILRMKREMNAVILAHYYQDSEIQDLADFVGDSLELSRTAAGTGADVIVFAGVHFMAETAKILCPGKEVLLPDTAAGCSLAESCPPQQFRAFREAHPDHLSLTYINCSAEVKAASDIICTSSSAVNIIRQLPPELPVLFAPDRNLGRYVSKITGRELLLWQGACIVHEIFSDRKIRELRVLHPEAKLIAHPECLDTILDQADFIGSTSALLQHVQRDGAREYIVATEAGILHQMQKARPDKRYYPAPPTNECACNECPYMKLNTLEKLYLCMRDRSPAIRLEEQVQRRALLPIRRMLRLASGGEGAMEEILREIRFPFSPDSLN